MKLETFFREIAPFLEGRTSHAQAVARLYGDDATAAARLDADRLGVYAELYRRSAFEILEDTFPSVHAWFERPAGGGGGAEAWQEVGQAYLLAHPLRSELWIYATASFPDFLRSIAGTRGVPPWLAEVADLELTHRLTTAAPDDPPDDAAGTLSLAPSVATRSYGHDLLDWIDRDPRPDAPTARPTIVLSWRTRDRVVRQEIARQELAVIRMIQAGRAAPESVEGRIPTPAEVQAAITRLRDAGVVGGSDGSSDGSPDAVPGHAETAPGGPARTRTEWREAAFDAFIREAALSDEQAQAFRRLMADEAEQVQALFDWGYPRDQVRQEATLVRNRTDEAVGAILSGAQHARYLGLRREQRERIASRRRARSSRP